MSTIPRMTPEQIAAYRATAKRRWRQERQNAMRRRERAWTLARRAARLLKTQCHAHRVVLFGSLARGGIFDFHSDVDLAVWGLDEKIYYRTVSRLLDIDPTISIDLVMAEQAPLTLLKAIEEEGVELCKV